ncbi:MAG: hypothetical protein U5K27_20265 [Desulfotignum sp.]|nr:hypothetical protein [Desulfotignum sp.]
MRFSTLFYDEGVRFGFLRAFKNFTRCMNLVFPARQALDFMERLQSHFRKSTSWQARHFRERTLRHVKGDSRQSCGRLPTGNLEIRSISIADI